MAADGQEDAQFAMLENAAKFFAGRARTKDAVTRPPPPGPAAPTTATSPEQLWRRQEWLNQQLVEHRGALNAANDNSPASSNDLENLQIRSCDLQKDLIEAETDASLKDLILQRLQQSITLSTTLFPAGGYSEETAEQKSIRERMAHLLEKQAELGSAILRIYKEIEELGPELEKTNKENLELLKQNRDLMWNVQQGKATNNQTPKKSDHKLNRLQAVYDQTLDKIKMERHVFQALMLGSGVNWGAEEKMRNLMVSLGMPLDKLLEQLN